MSEEIKYTAEAIIEKISGTTDANTLYFTELRLGAGYGGVSERRIDLFKVMTAPSKGHKTTCYEVKISRSDFRNDIKKPKKQRGARLFCDEFFYVTPPGLLKVEEVPLWAGLIEVDLSKGYKYDAMKTIVPAPALDKERPTWGLVVAAARNSSGWFRNEKLIAENQALQRQIGGLERNLRWAQDKLKTATSDKGDE